MRTWLKEATAKRHQAQPLNRRSVFAPGDVGREAKVRLVTDWLRTLPEEEAKAPMRIDVIAAATGIPREILGYTLRLAGWRRLKGTVRRWLAPGVVPPRGYSVPPVPPLKGRGKTQRAAALPNPTPGTTTEALTIDIQCRGRAFQVRADPTHGLLHIDSVDRADIAHTLPMPRPELLQLVDNPALIQQPIFVDTLRPSLRRMFDALEQREVATSHLREKRPANPARTRERCESRIMEATNEHHRSGRSTAVASSHRVT